MKKIIILNKMFVATKTLVAIDENKVIEETAVSPAKLIETVFSLADRYDIETVEIKGSKIYSSGLKKDLTKAMGSKYSRQLNINII